MFIYYTQTSANRRITIVLSPSLSKAHTAEFPFWRRFNTSGSIYYNNRTITCSANNTWYKWTGTSAVTAGFCNYDSANGELEISARGMYRIEFSASHYATTGFISRMAIFKNGSVVNETIREVFHASAGSSAPRSLAGSFIFEQTSDTTVLYDLRGQVSAGASQDLVINYGTLIVHRI